MNDQDLKELKGFLDAEGRLTSAPARKKKKMLSLLYLREKLEDDRCYTEREVNEFLNRWHTYGDPATLRRELVDFGILNRDSYGRQYRKSEEEQTLEQLCALY